MHSLNSFDNLWVHRTSYVKMHKDLALPISKNPVFWYFFLFISVTLFPWSLMAWMAAECNLSLYSWAARELYFCWASVVTQLCWRKKLSYNTFNKYKTRLKILYIIQLIFKQICQSCTKQLLNSAIRFLRISYSLLSLSGPLSKGESIFTCGQKVH